MVDVDSGCGDVGHRARQLREAREVFAKIVLGEQLVSLLPSGHPVKLQTLRLDVRRATLLALIVLMIIGTTGQILGPAPQDQLSGAPLLEHHW